MDLLSGDAERLFTRLLMVVDDFGRYSADPQLLKSMCFPLRKDITDVQVAEWLDHCITAKLILKYEVDGRSYISIEKFKQRTRSVESKFPAPPSSDRHLTVKRSPRRETETETDTSASTSPARVFGTDTKASYVLVTPKLANEKPCRIQGADGLREYLESQRSTLNYPEHAEKFMRTHNGNHYNEMMHLKNAFEKWVKQLYK